MDNDLLKRLGILGLAAGFAYFSVKSNNLRDELRNSPKIEYHVKINKDSISDILVNDKKNNQHFVLLSNPDGTYEKSDILHSDQGNFVHSIRDNGSYNIATGKFIPDYKN